MGSLVDDLEKEVLDHMFKVGAYTPAATVYVGLSTADPLDAETGIAEPVGNGYARKIISFGAASGRIISQDAIVTFDQATGTWGTITHYALFDAVSAGNMLAHGALTASKLVSSGNIPSIASGEVDISFSTGGVGTEVATQILNWLFDGGTFAQPTNLWIALCKTAAIVDADTGLTITELAMTGYARTACDNWDTASGTLGATANTSDVDFGQLTSTGETCVAMCVIDSTSGDGEIYAYTNDPNQAIADGDTVKVLAGEFDVTLD